MANFYIRASAQILPIEEITFTDSTQKAKGIHSTLDKTYSAMREKLIGTTATDIKEFKFVFGDDGLTEEKTFKALTGVNNITFLYAVMTVDTDEEGVYIKVGGTTLTAEYIGSFNAGQVGAFVLLSNCSIAGDKMFIGTSGAYAYKEMTFLVAI